MPLDELLNQFLNYDLISAPLSAWLAWWLTRRRFYRQAVAGGRGHWEFNKQTGRAEWVWADKEKQ